MVEHADTIRRAREVAQGLASEFTEGDPSDVWTQGEVYEHVYDPLDKHLRLLADLADALLVERQQALRLLTDVLPHLEDGHDEARIWAQNVRSFLGREP